MEATLVESISTERKILLNPSLFKWSLMVHTMVGVTAAFVGTVLIISAVTMAIISSTSQPPVAQNDFAETYKSNYVDIPVLKNDYDLKLSKLEILEVFQPVFGKVLILDSQNVRYFPDNFQNYGKHYSGDVEFVYVVRNDKLSSKGMIKVKILNNPPEPVTLTTKIQKNSKKVSLEVFTMKNEFGKSNFDIDQDILMVTSIFNQNSLIGDASISPDGQSILYTPFPNSLETEIINYQISDGNDTVNANLTVEIENSPPVANPDYIEWNQNTIIKNLDLLKNDVDINNDALKITSVRNVGSGRIIITKNGTFVDYFPSLGVYSDSFEYTITDGLYSSSSFVVVSMMNNKPYFRNQIIQISKNSEEFEIHLDYGDIDPFSTLNMEMLSNSVGNVRLTSKFTDIVATRLEGVDSLIKWKNNSWTCFYKPKKDQVYKEVLEFKIDDNIDFSIGNLTINVINDRPVANNDHFKIPYNSQGFLNLVQNDFDPNKDRIQIESIQNPTVQGGIVEIVNGSFILYHPPSKLFQGQDSFTYTISDRLDNHHNAKISNPANVDVILENFAPTANDDVFIIKAGEEVKLEVLVNDYDPNGNEISIAHSDIHSKFNRKLTVQNNSIIYSSIAYQDSMPYDSFSYYITDGSLNSNLATVAIYFQNSSTTNYPPTCSSFSKIINKSMTYEWDFLSEKKIHDPTIHPLVIFVNPETSTKGVNFVHKTTMKFKSFPNRSGELNFNYFVSDGMLNSSNCQVSLTITNKAPKAIDDHFQYVKKDSGIYVLNPLENDHDSDGDELKLLSVSNQQASIVNNTILFKPTNVDLDSPSTEFEFTYSISDGDIDNPRFSSATIFVTLIKSLPHINDDLIKVEQNTNAIIPIQQLLINDGGNGETIEFNQLEDCSTLDPLIYCIKKPILNTPEVGYITVPYTFNSCKENKFKYCINSATNKKAISCGTVTVQYKNCICRQPIDVVFIVDSSGSISNKNWNLQMDFIQNITKKLIISDSNMNVGLIQYGEVVKIISMLTSDRSAFQKAIESIRFHHMASWTNTLGALNEAVKLLTVGNPTSTIDRSGVSKIILLLTDGLANRPCDCGACLCESVFCITPTSRCEWNPEAGKFCQPCSDPSNRAQEINSWRNPNWKIIALGIGEELNFYNEKGMKMVRQLNYDYETTIHSPWNKLDQVLSQIVDQSCNI